MKTSKTSSEQEPFYSAKEEVDELSARQLKSESYQLAFTDEEFLLREELRPIRLQLELLKPEMIQHDQHIRSTVVFIGSSRIDDEKKAKARLQQIQREARAHPKDRRLAQKIKIAKSRLAKSYYYDEARKLAHMISVKFQQNKKRDFVVVTGGGPGIMEAGNRGAFDAGAKSIGLSMVLPDEQMPNPYISPELCFQFHYFAIRKMHFLIRSRAIVTFPGGYGTFDELFEVLTLLQMKKISRVPLLLFGKKYWSKIINFEALVAEDTIDEDDLNLFQYVETAEEAMKKILDFYETK